MDKKKKIVVLLGLLVGAVFLWVGFNGIHEKNVEAEKIAAEAAGTVDENSADALGNIQ